jgi:hypothetical protein
MKIPKKRGALFFTIDTMVAGIVFTLTAVIVLSLYINQPVTQDTYQALSNYISYVTDIKMESFRNVYLFIYDDHNETDPTFSVYQKIDKLEMEGKHDIAEDFVKNFTDIIVPDQFGISYYIDGTLIYERFTGREEYTTTNLSASLLTFYIANDTTIGPNITRVSIWS